MRVRMRRPVRLCLTAAAAAVLSLGFAQPAQADTLPTPGSLGVLTANPDCTLTVPAFPRTAHGLATPYILNGAGQVCTEGQALGAFVQATILNPVTGKLSVYDPAVITAGQTPPVIPPVPRLEAGDVVAIWTGFNGNELKLTGPGAGQFVNFAQQSYDNSPAFFAVLRADVRAGLVHVPAVGTASDGQACPTSRDFSLVDQDQSDNVPVTYTYDGGASNGSDEQLLTLVQQSLGCAEWKVPLLDPAVAVGDGAGMSTSGILQEEQASVAQKAPVALVPGNDEFVTNNGQFVPPNGTGQPDLFFQDLYRRQTGQPLTVNGQDTLAYCQKLSSTGAPRLALDAATEAKFPAPAFAMIGTNLANVLAGRFQATWNLLNCPGLTGSASPITPVVDMNTGLVTSATYPGGTTPTPTPTPSMTTAGTPTPTPSMTIAGTPTSTPSMTTTPTVTPTSTPSMTTTTAAGKYTLVQQSHTVSDPTATEGPLTSDNAAPAAPVLGTPVTGGDLVVIWATANDSGGTFPLAVSGTGWMLAAEGGGAFNWTGVWYKTVTAGEAMPVVSDPAGGNGGTASSLAVQASEFSGAGALDRHGSGTVADGTAVAAGGPDAAGDLVVAVATWNGGNVSPALSLALTGGTGTGLGAQVTTDLGSVDFAGGPPFSAFAWAPGTAGAQPDTATATASQFENDAAVVIASFKPA